MSAGETGREMDPFADPDPDASQDSGGDLGADEPAATRPLPEPEHIFRAAPMTLVQMYISTEAAREVVGALGAMGCVHFRDLNADVSSFNRQFIAEIRRLDDALRTLRLLEQYTGGTADINGDFLREPLIPSAEVAEAIERMQEDASRLGTLVSAHKKMADRRDMLLEERFVLLASNQFFAKRRTRKAAASTQRRRGADEAPLLAEEEEDVADFEVGDEYGEFDIDAEDPLADDPPSQPMHHLESAGIVAGVIERTKSPALERLCWRATRGNLYFAHYAVENRDTDVFLVYTHGHAYSERVVRIAESIGARMIDFDAETRVQRLQAVNDQLTELFTVLDQTDESMTMEKEVVSARLPGWKAIVLAERAVFEILNLFSTDTSRRGLIAEGWVPTDQLNSLKNEFARLSSATSQLIAVHTVQTSKTPPTYHTVNKVTQAFQVMVDIYGVARYGEVNPGLPTVITFPFMFAVMFGDLGHGFILFLFAMYLVWNEARIGAIRNRDELLNMAYMGRYVLLFMGLFSMFTGIIYNDLFSKGMTVFKSAFAWENGNGTAARVGHATYPIGIDWAWHGAENNLRFTNSYKMKLSVLLGFVHMSYSLAFQYVNARHFKSWVDIWGNFVPSVLFMQSIFGYLSLTIVYKWCVDWIGDRAEPPSLLDMLIKMFLSPGSVDPPLYRGQAFVQVVLVIMALVCVPWLLLFKPLYLKRQLKGQPHMPLELDEHTFAIDEDEGNELAIHDASDDDEETQPHEAFGDILIHQVIHTIEFCLNCISHTASYLRLWALSLAHNQLSQVLWNMTLRNAFGPTGAGGVFAVVALFAMWLVITVLVLVCMEGTSAMLHALRLHWVEAMSKHFEGEGYAFKPFSLLDIENDTD